MNTLLGVEKRVAMTNRKEYPPDAAANELLHLLFEYTLKRAK